MEVLQKIKSGDYQTIEVAGKSDIWGYFRKIVNTSTHENVPYVICCNCERIFKYAKGASSSNLKKHVCYKRRFSEESDAEPMMKLSLVSVSDQLREEAIKHCVRFICRDLQAPDAVNRNGFKELARCLVEIGVKLGTVNFKVDDILPHVTTIKRRLHSLHLSEREMFVSKLRPIIKRGMCAGTVNIWTDDRQKRTFTTFTVNYINSEWELQNRILFTTELECGEDSGTVVKKTTENIIAVIEAKFDELNLDRDLLKKISYATDQVSYMKKSSLNRKIQCGAHVVNTILKHTFDKDTLKNRAPNVLDLMRKCKYLVENFWRIGSALETTAEQECPSGWNSEFTILYTIRNNFNAIKENLEQTGQSQRLIGIEKQLLDRVINLLEPFNNVTIQLQAEKVPTIHLVLLHMHVLKEKLMKLRNEETNHEIRFIIANCLDNVFDAYCCPHKIHKISAFLWPKYKQMRYLNEQQRKEVHDLIKKELIKMTEVTHAEHSDDSPSGSADMKPSVDDDILLKYADVHLTEEHKPESQITVQMKMYQNVCYPENNILLWWKHHADEFPLLAKLARKVLCIPATSTANEKLFSSVNRVLDKRKASLEGENVDAILFLHSQLK